MAKYTSDANLIRGAATAYKNYDNAPGMYAGLDKAIKAGTDTMNTAVENKRVAEAKALKKKEEEEKRAKELNNAFYEMSAPIHEAAGGFDEVTGKYASVAAKLEELQPRYIDVMQNGTATEKASVQKEYNNIKNDVSLNVEYRASVADPKNGISVAAMGIGDGRDLEFVTKYLGDKVKADPKPNEKGEETYTIDINGTPMTKTFAEINAMTIFSDQKVFIDVLDVTKKLGSSLKGAELDEYTRQDFEREIRSTLPDEENAMLAFMNDKGFDGKGFIDLISKSNNRASIEEEIMSMEEFNANGGGISQPEWENFTKAMTNPYHKTWEKADGTHDKKAWFEMSQQIVTEQMANGAENRHALNNPEDPIWKKEGYANKGAYLKAGRGTLTGNNWLGVDLNKSVYTFNIKGEGATYVKQKDMKNTADTILNIEKKGTGFFEGYDGITYTHKDGKWSVLSYNENTELQENTPYDRANMLTNLKFSDKPQMLEYLKKVESEKKKKKKKPAPNLKMAKELQAVGDLKARGRIWVKSLDKYFESDDESTAYEKAVEAIKAKYKTKK